MGRKKGGGKKKKNKSSGIGDAIRNMAEQDRIKSMSESFAQMAMMDMHSLEKQKEIIRNSLISMGTDCEKNDSDPMGNGDQSMIKSRSAADAARELYAIGGDIDRHAQEGAISGFGQMCMIGNQGGVCDMVNNVKKLIEEEQNIEPWYYSSDSRQKMVALLETRETSMRLSPLLLIVSIGKNVCGMPGMDHKSTAKFLLETGANPYAQDVLGKTVAHYGAGAFATSMTLDVVDMCVQAAKSAHFFGKKVELFGLKAQHMNGLEGIVGGHSYDPEESGRRIVYLLQEKKEIKVKPCNLRLVDNASDACESKMLLDVQDRMGCVSLLEVVMQDRKDVAEFLLVKHNASIHTEDMDGMSPLKLCTGGGQMMAKNVSKLVNDVVRREGKESLKAKKQATNWTCANCKKDLTDMETPKACGGCNSVTYCGRDCQVAHWNNGHKAECKILKASMEGVKLRAPPSGMCYASISMSTRKKHDAGSYRNPRGVELGEKFVVKVQGGTEFMAILVYDETRTCEFQIEPGAPGFKEVLAEIKKEMAWNGRKTFMKASFDRKGNCTIFPATAGVKAKYSW